MATLTQYQTRMLMVGAGFSEAAFTSNPGLAWRGDFASFESRNVRYDVFWAHYEGNVYRRIFRFQPELKQEYGLYDATRSVLSPAYRLGEFWPEHLYGGRLDPAAGDGTTTPSAIPILTQSPKEQDVRQVIAMINRDSNWQANKDTWTRFGAVLGDVGLMIFDDQKRKKVYFRPIHPRIVREVALDPQRNCKGYIFEELRPDPRVDDPLVTPPNVLYTETADRVGGRIRYRTYLEGELYDWREYEDGEKRIGPDWTEEYDFIPFIWHQHRDMGLGAGWSEMQPSLSKLYELDDIASKIDDQVRKMVDCPWLFAGVTEANLVVTYGNSEDPKSPKTTVPIICVESPDVKPTPLIAPLDIAAASAHCMKILEDLERNHEELQADMATASGDASGRALRVARERVEARVAARRAGYDDALVRAYQMAISIGARKGYPGYEAFSADSYANGELDLAIGDRPVFAVDKMDHLEERTAFWTMVDKAVATGVPLEIVLEDEGWSPERIHKIVEYREKKAAAAQARVADRMAQAERAGQAIEDQGGDQLGAVA